MKKIFLAFLMLPIIATLAFAFPYDIKFLSKEEIHKLSNDVLIETYTDAKIEIEASKVFHNRAGFVNGKEYQQHKDLLRYVINLRMEMDTREDLKVPDIDKMIN